MIYVLFHLGETITEAADAQYVLGPYPDLPTATDVGERVYDRCRHQPYLYDSLFYSFINLSNVSTNEDAAVKDLTA